MQIHDPRQMYQPPVMHQAGPPNSMSGPPMGPQPHQIAAPNPQMQQHVQHHQPPNFGHNQHPNQPMQNQQPNNPIQKDKLHTTQPPHQIMIFYQLVLGS